LTAIDTSILPKISRIQRIPLVSWKSDAIGCCTRRCNKRFRAIENRNTDIQNNDNQITAAFASPIPQTTTLVANQGLVRLLGTFAHRRQSH
jgi:hypothetical protein